MQEALAKVGTDGFGPLIEAMKESGRVLDEDFIDGLDAASDTLDALGNKMKIWAANRINDVTNLGRVWWSTFKNFWTEDGGLAMPSFSRAIRGAMDEVEALDAEKDQRSDQRAARREERERRDKERRDAALQLSLAKENGDGAGASGGRARLAQVDSLRRIGALALGGRTPAEDLGRRAQIDIAKSTGSAAETLEQIKTILSTPTPTRFVGRL
jgi:hypothetical protein